MNPAVPFAQESQFRALIETALDIVSVLNHDGTIRYISPSAQRILGYAPQEMIGENAFAYMHPDDAAGQLEAFKFVVSSPELATAGDPHSFRFRHRDGRWVVLEAVSTKLPAGPEPPGVVINARDVTERTQAHESMLETVTTERRFAQESEVIAELGRIVSSTLNIEEVFEAFAGQVKRLIRFDMVLASHVDYSRQTSTVRYWSGPSAYRENFVTTVALDGSLTGEVLAQGKPVVVHGASSEEIRQRYSHLLKSHQGGVLSWLGIPMVHRGQTIGALLFVSSEPQAFSDMDITLAERVSNQISGAIDNAGLFAELKETEADLAASMIERSESATQIEVIAEIGRIIGSTLNVDEVYQPLADQVRKLIDFDVLAICVVERDRELTRIAHRSGDQVTGLAVGTRVPFDGSLTGEVASVRRTIVVQGNSEQLLEERFPNVVEGYREGMRSWICSPLINRSDFVGSILIVSKKENAFTERDLELAQRVGNQIAGAIGNALLYADLKKTEADLAASNDRNQMILETAHDAFVGIDDRGRVVAWNSQAEKTFGWTAGEAMHCRLAELIIPDRFAGRHKAGIRQFLATGNGAFMNQRIEMVAKHRDGHEFPVESTISPLKIGERYLFNAFVRDITGLRESQAALRRSEQRFRTVYNSAAIGIGSRALDGTIKYMNPAFLQMLDYTLDEIQELAPGELFDVSYSELERGQWERAIEGIEIPHYEKEFIRKDGTKVYTDVRASLERDDEGNPIGIVTVVTDITERKRLEIEVVQYTESLETANRELQQLDRMKDEFISTVSHELRTPLTSIKGSAELLLTYDDDDRETQLEFLRIINNESDRLTRLINDVLDLSRMESRQMQWVWEDLDLLKVVNESVDGTQALVIQKNLTISVELDSDLPNLWNDHDRLVQVLTNLLSNSIKFTPRGGRVWITATEIAADESDGLGAKLKICVSDNGVGIPHSEFDNIFQKFTQVGDSISDKPKGTGLGLTICKEIVEFCGGKIWVESTPGEGSSFYFTVPVYPR